MFVNQYRCVHPRKCTHAHVCASVHACACVCTCHGAYDFVCTFSIPFSPFRQWWMPRWLPYLSWRLNVRKHKRNLSLFLLQRQTVWLKDKRMEMRSQWYETKWMSSHFSSFFFNPYWKNKVLTSLFITSWWVQKHTFPFLIFTGNHRDWNDLRFHKAVRL